MYCPSFVWRYILAFQLLVSEFQVEILYYYRLTKCAFVAKLWTNHINPAKFNVVKGLQYIGASELREDFSLNDLTLGKGENSYAYILI